MKNRLLEFLIPLAIGTIGFIIAWSLWHLYVDHQSLHAIINMINNQASQAVKK